MDGHRRVVLVGDSLLLDAVEASLKEHPDLVVLRIRSIGGPASERILALDPDLVIFDLYAPQLQFLVPLLLDHPKLRLIGLDVHSSQVVALSGQPYTTPAASDLARVISEHVFMENGAAESPELAPNLANQDGISVLPFV